MQQSSIIRLSVRSDSFRCQKSVSTGCLYTDKPVPSKIKMASAIPILYFSQQSGERYHCRAIADRELFITSINDEFFICPDIIADSAKYIAYFRCDTKFDFNRPDVVKAKPDQQVNFRSSRFPVIKCFCNTRKNRVNVFDYKTLPALPEHRVRQQ